MENKRCLVTFFHKDCIGCNSRVTEDDINLDKLLEVFGTEYEELYTAEENGKRIDDYRICLDLFDDVILKAFPDLVERFADKRGDFISSDREAVAFTKALSIVASSTYTTKVYDLFLSNTKEL